MMGTSVCKVQFLLNNISKINMSNNPKKRVGKYIIFMGEKLGSGAFA